MAESNRGIDKRPVWALPALDAFFNPRGVAVVGASAKPNTPGYIIIEQLRKRYKGRIYPVNPKYREVLGLKSYPSVLEVPDPLDLAVIVTPAPTVPGIMEDAGKRGVRAAIVVSGGFAEIGGEGVRLQEELRKVSRKYGIRVIGPNCIGVLDTKTGIDTFFLPEEKLPRPKPGHIAIASQSGALLSMWLEWLAGENIGVSKAVSYGNKVDVDEADIIEYLADDPDTRLILLYIEGFAPNRAKVFRRAVSKALVKGKPIVVLKGGKTERGSVAAASHTASLASNYALYASFFRQVGVVEVDDMQELFDVAKAYIMVGPARNRRIAIVTNAGGEGVLATDYVVKLGLEVPYLSDNTIRRLSARLKPPAVVGNPVDLTAGTSDEEYLFVLETLLEEEELGAIMVIAPPHPPGMKGVVAEYVAKIYRKYGVPIVAVVTGGRLAEDLAKKFEDYGIPAYPTPERAAKALAGIVRIGEVLSRKH